MHTVLKNQTQSLLHMPAKQPLAKKLFCLVLKGVTLEHVLFFQWECNRSNLEHTAMEDADLQSKINSMPRFSLFFADFSLLLDISKTLSQLFYLYWVSLCVPDKSKRIELLVILPDLHKGVQIRIFLNVWAGWPLFWRHVFFFSFESWKKISLSSFPL